VVSSYPSDMSTDRLLRTGEVASAFSVSRQHVVDMCNQGKLPFVMVGSHRRIPERAVISKTGGVRDYHRDGHAQSLALHAAIVPKLINDPERVLGIARKNVQRDYTLGDAHSVAYTCEWESVMDAGIPALIDTMLDPSERGTTLRSCTPFTGVLNPDEVQAIKRVYRKQIPEVA
jgi:excisionase family DNA binding protein